MTKGGDSSGILQNGIPVGKEANFPPLSSQILESKVVDKDNNAFQFIREKVFVCST